MAQGTIYTTYVEEMEQVVEGYLESRDKGYGYYKRNISKNTGIPIDILTVILKRLKEKGKVRLIMIWSEDTGMPDGSGYVHTDNWYDND